MNDGLMVLLRDVSSSSLLNRLLALQLRNCTSFMAFGECAEGYLYWTPTGSPSNLEPDAPMGSDLDFFCERVVALRAELTLGAQSGEESGLGLLFRFMSRLGVPSCHGSSWSWSTDWMRSHARVASVR